MLILANGKVNQRAIPEIGDVVNIYGLAYTVGVGRNGKKVLRSFSDPNFVLRRIQWLN